MSRRYRVVAALLVVVMAVGSGGATAAEDEQRGWRWVWDHPMFISALVVSMPPPPPQVIADYFGPFGATAVSLWQDGADTVGWWGLRPFVTWLDDDATSVRWDPGEEAFVSTGEPLGGLGADYPGRIGYQVGDEPLTVTRLVAILDGIRAVREADPDALAYTNFSYFAPEREAILNWWEQSPLGDLQMSSDYFLGTLHYSVLERFRQAALRKGVPYWQYLNAYIGSESDFARTHTASDLRWQAMAGLAYGYTGHIWFLYQVAAEGHPTATNWGGSALHDGVGSWSAPRTPLWDVVAQVNRELANLGRTVRALTSRAVRLTVAPGTAQPFATTPWRRGAGGIPHLTEVRPGDGEGPMDILTGLFVGPEGDPYVMVQNARHTHARGAAADPLPSADLPGRIKLTFDFTGAPFSVTPPRLLYMDPASGQVRSLELLFVPPAPSPPPPPPPPGQPAPPPVEPPPPPPIYTAEVTVSPGGVFFFKYDNTIPFRLGRQAASVGLVDPLTGVWSLRDGLVPRTFYYGNPGDRPFMGDWDCDGIDTPGLYRQSDGFVYLRNSNTQGIADVEFFFGNPDDVPLPGDFDGDGCDTVSLYRPSEGRFYIINRLGSGQGGLGVADYAIDFGDRGDTPFVGDFDGDGIDSFGLHRPSTGQVFLRNPLTSGNAQLSYYFGDPADRFVAGDWDGDGVATPGLFRPATATVYLRSSNTPGPADLSFPFGDTPWIPVAGVLH